VSDNYWTDRAQNKRIAGLEDDLSYMSASLSQARASTDRLKAELSKVQGSIEQRLTRLSAAFDAFVEISDLRVTLGLFDAHGRVRHQAKQLLTGASVGDVADAEGYWLAPALVALRGVADGVVDPDAFALATARDPLRAKAFHVLLAAEHGARLPSFTEALPELADPVPTYQRALWLLAADGFFGPVGWEHGVRLLSAHADEALAGTIRSLAQPATAVTVPKDLDGGGDLATVLQACEKLTVLRSWVASAIEGYTGEPATSVDPVARRSLDLLIDEGSPVELPLLARERELRAVIEGEKSSASATWDSPAGTAAELLRADLAAERPDRKAMAVRASATVILDVAEKFAATARTRPPEELTVRTRYGQVTITTTEPDRASLEKAVDTVGRVAQVESHRRATMFGSFAVAVLFLALTFVAGWGWVFVAAGAAGIGVYQRVADTRERRAAAENAKQLQEKLREDVANRVEVFAKTRRELQERQSRVTEDMAALQAALATVAG
jgi:uncharacterized protein YlxW (UPF0749 family)